jgi:Domain of unknown function (DUF6970)
VKTTSRYWRILLTFGVLAHAVGCARTAEDPPPFVDRLVARLRTDVKRNPPASIWRYTYKGVEVLYVPPYCCDVPGELYDRAGNVICSPDGGISGEGDGACRDFFSERSDEQIVWADTR